MIREISLALIKLHILYHATRQAVYGLALIQELESHGYSLSPGTLYPLLHKLEKAGWLAAEKRVVNGKARKYYRATETGQAALLEAQARMRELLAEMDEGRIIPEEGE
ncbi:MAG: helix-turn-helix transcriptional regulator [Chloroflexi bacterium]|nr:helix-turn-helix transcriptional regulator [Chloroflexota bacterium]